MQRMPDEPNRNDAPSPLRSMLFVPGDSERKLAKAQTVPADALILDLEDSVDAARKHAARELAAEFLARPLGDPRAHALGSDQRASATRASPPTSRRRCGRDADGIVLPKPRSVADVLALGQAARRARGAHRAARSASRRSCRSRPRRRPACSRSATTRDCGPRLAALTWGAEDLSAALGASDGRRRARRVAAAVRARALAVLAGRRRGRRAGDRHRAHGRRATRDGLRALSASAAQRDGFAGKLAIHPDQVEILNRSVSADGRRPSPRRGPSSPRSRQPAAPAS